MYRLPLGSQAVFTDLNQSSFGGFPSAMAGFLQNMGNAMGNTCFYCKHYKGFAEDNGTTGLCLIFNVIKLHNDKCRKFDHN